MGTPMIANPASYEAVHRDDVSAVERWADEQRAELARLTSELHSLLEASPVDTGLDDVDRRLADDSHRAVVDTMLSAAAQRLDRVVEVARAEAAAVVEEAVREAATLLRSVGAPDEAIERATAHQPLPRPEPQVPRDAAQLQRELNARAVLCTPARVTAPRASEQVVLDLTEGASDPAHDLFWGNVAAEESARERWRWRAQRRQP